MPVFTPNLTTLPPPQRQLWSELASTPETFMLYGGTALALRLGHRVSADFDFFSNQPFDPDDWHVRYPISKLQSASRGYRVFKRPFLPSINLSLRWRIVNRHQWRR